MKKEKPLVAILMAIYEPRMDWLREQLESLNAQTYPTLRLYIRDDCSPTVSLKSIEALVCKCITKIPYTLVRNNKNLGSNETFALLTEEAEGVYFAYCDQDDIWLPEKLSILQEVIEREKAQLVCSDMLIINGDGKQLASSMTKLRRRHVFRSGENLASKLIVSGFVTGCTMLMRSEMAKKALPFCPYMVHDHYLSFCAATEGKIISLPDRLVQYRMHGDNQTAVMAGVRDRESYFRIRIKQLRDRVHWLQERFGGDKALGWELNVVDCWSAARERNFLGEKGQKHIIWEYRYLGKAVSLFEIVETMMPKRLFSFCITLMQKGIL